MNKRLVSSLFLTSALACANAGASTLPFADFEDGTTMGWDKGELAESPNTVEMDANGNHYLVLKSKGDFTVFGARERDPRIVWFSHDPSWHGNLHDKGVKSIKVQMRNLGEEELTMRLGIGNAYAGLRERYMSDDSLNLPADGQWYNLQFAISEDHLHLSNRPSPVPQTVDDVMRYLATIRFMHGEGVSWSANDKTEAVLHIDNIMASTELRQGISAVPLPAALWMFLPALGGLLRVSRVNRR